MNMEIQVKIIEAMTKIARENVKNFFSDFTCYDIPTLVRHWEDFKIGFWFVRECGTHLLLVNKDTDIADVMNTLNCYARYNDKVFVFFNNKDRLMEFDIDLVRSWSN